MLLSLTVKDFVIVDHLSLDFASGFTVLTGETGAGKSIILDALGLALGDRSEGAQVVREGCDRADIAALFNIAERPEIKAWLRENELEGDPGELLLRRIVDKSGRSKSMTPPLGLALATWWFGNRFTRDEREAGKAAAVLGISFITEGAIPFAARDPFRVIPALMIGSALTGALSMGMGVQLRVPHGGVFVLPIPNAVTHLGMRYRIRTDPVGNFNLTFGNQRPRNRGTE